MDYRNMDFEQKDKVLKYIGEAYQRSRKRLDMRVRGRMVAENSRSYESDRDLVGLIDRTLRDCSADTRCIIINDYLISSRPAWYKSYYPASTYYRLKHKALEEFIRCLNM